MGSARTHYEILGVAPDASSVEIRAAYRELARRLHPDVAGRPTASGGAEMHDVNAAWAVLCDDRRRAAYDRTLRRQEPHSEVVTPPATEPDVDSVDDLGAPLFTTDSLVVASLVRGWPVILAGLLLLIFVFTAYATGGESDSPGPPTSDAAWEEGDCVDRLPEPTKVPCTAEHDARVSALRSNGEGCTGVAGAFVADVPGPLELCIVYDR